MSKQPIRENGVTLHRPSHNTSYLQQEQLLAEVILTFLLNIELVNWPW